MFLLIGETPPKDDNFFLTKDWFHQFTWWEKTQEDYAHWFANFIYHNWKGITTKRVKSKRERERLAWQFILNYWFKEYE